MKKRNTSSVDYNEVIRLVQKKISEGDCGPILQIAVPRKRQQQQQRRRRRRGDICPDDVGEGV